MMMNLLQETYRMLGIASVIGLGVVIILMIVGGILAHNEVSRGASICFCTAMLVPIVALLCGLFLPDWGYTLPSDIWTPTEDLTVLSYALMFSCGIVGGIGGAQEC